MVTIGITQYALGQCWNERAGTMLVGITPDELIALCNRAIVEGAMLVDGYVPFCKHLFVKNPSPTVAGVTAITEEYQHLLRSGYVARRPEEVPVLERWFDAADVAAPRAEWLDVILYSREQLALEEADKPAAERDVPDADWSIVGVNAETEASETPMSPITVMRNALGPEEGGSGVPIDREAYAKSVAFWERHAAIR